VGIYVLPFVAVNGCNLGLNPISCKSSRAARLSFVFPFMSKIVPSMLSMTFLSMCMTSRLYRSKLSFQYDSLKKILFFFHTTSSNLLHSSSAYSVYCYRRSHPQMQFRPTVGRSRPRMAHLEHILILQYRPMLFYLAATNVKLASISCAPYSKISCRSSNI